MGADGRLYDGDCFSACLEKSLGAAGAFVGFM